jgi:hypothetical protein
MLAQDAKRARKIPSLPMAATRSRILRVFQNRLRERIAAFRAAAAWACSAPVKHPKIARRTIVLMINSHYPYLRKPERGAAGLPAALFDCL